MEREVGTPSISRDLTVKPMTIEYQIRELEKQWQLHRYAAINRNEPPSGYNRKRAEQLELKLYRLREKQKMQSNPDIRPGSSLAFIAIATCTLTYFTLIVISWLQHAQPMQSISGKAESGITMPREGETQKPDPALAMQARFYGSKVGGAYSDLDSGFNNYQRLSGTLARIQSVALKKRSAAEQLPTVWINRTSEKCFDRSSIGVYSPKCQVIKLDYTDGYTTYEHPVEMEVTLAHEWGHHLISLSGVAMSPTEQEVVSDCFAGAVFGYYARNYLITVQEATRAIDLVAYVGNNSPMATTRIAKQGCGRLWED